MSSLNKIFQTAEKVEQEKKLEVIATPQATLEDLTSYFFRMKSHPHTGPVNFRESCKFLQTYKITPQIIASFEEKIKESRPEWYERYTWGEFVSALVQASYDQGFNNFKFEEIEAAHFGSYLVGKNSSPICIKVKIIKPWAMSSFGEAENCAVEIDVLAGEFAFGDAFHCKLKIRDYEGDRFGFGMDYCKIYSPNKATLKKLRESIPPRKNRFILTKN